MEKCSNGKHTLIKILDLEIRKEDLTNNIGCMSREAIEIFTDKVLKECNYPYTMKWTTAGNIMIEPFIYIDERNIDQYPYITKYWVLHEIAHIDTHPQDDRHGEIFHSKLAELMNRFLAGGSQLVKKFVCPGSLKCVEINDLGELNFKDETAWNIAVNDYCDRCQKRAEANIYTGKYDDWFFGDAGNKMTWECFKKQSKEIKKK